jgi:hypothetical protein
MLKLKAVQAEFGDCLLLEFGVGSDLHHVLIDGGPPCTYENHLKGVLQALSAANQKLDLVILSHVDNDHVAGLVDMLTELLDQDTNHKPWTIDFGGLWHNSFAQTIDTDGSIINGLASLLSVAGSRTLRNTSDAYLGVPEGNRLRTLDLQLRKPLNKGFSNGLILVDTATDQLIGGLVMKIVGPTQANLDSLREEWKKYLAKLANAVASNDVSTLANADKSIPNLSSIMVLAQYSGKSILLTGDGRSDHLLDGLKMAGLLDQSGCLHLNILKLSHHGSNRDITEEFFEKVTADTYVVSANGKDGNPDADTLQWLLQAAQKQERKFILVSTNDTKSLKDWRKKHPAKKYNYELRLMEKNEHFIDVEVE